MEKVRFEAFNVEELRVLRRACYEAGAAFGDPGHTAAERATLDDLAVEILGELKKKEAAAARIAVGRLPTRICRSIISGRCGYGMKQTARRMIFQTLCPPAGCATIISAQTPWKCFAGILQRFPASCAATIFIKLAWPTGTLLKMKSRLRFSLKHRKQKRLPNLP